LQHAQVELHHVPADDDVRIVARQPGVQALDQLARRGAVFEIEIDGRRRRRRRAQHIDLALAAAFQRDGVQVAVGAGFDSATIFSVGR
jgi:hypothetical protein